MSRGGPAAMAAAALAAALALGTGVPRSTPTAYLDGPPPGHTGGFGEETCHRCHFDLPLREDGEALRLEGLPDGYAPGHRYELHLTLAREGVARAGFQLSARFEEGARRGQQAGELRPADGRTQVLDSAGVQYIHHTREGSAAEGSPAAAWSIVWIAPEGSAEPVVFHVAGNASNDDASEFGDEIHARAVRLGPSAAGGRHRDSPKRR